MSVYRRYFKVPFDSPVHVRLNEIMDLHDAAGEAYHRIKDAVGAESISVYLDTMKLAGFYFNPRLDHPDWTKPDRSDGIQRPRRTTVNGKKLWAEIEAVPKCENIYSALEIAGLSSSPLRSLTVGCTWYRATLAWKRGAYLFVSVPWMDEDPETLRKYKEGSYEGRRDGNLQHLLWEPPADWVEVKRWEMDREIDEAKDPKEAA